jgi:hypothetical protein
MRITLSREQTVVRKQSVTIELTDLDHDQLGELLLALSGTPLDFEGEEALSIMLTDQDEMDEEILDVTEVRPIEITITR